MKKEEYYLNRSPIWILKRTHSSSKMAKQQLRALTALAKDSSLVPSTHVKRLKIAYNSRSNGSDAQFRPPGAHTDTWHTCREANNPTYLRRYLSYLYAKDRGSQICTYIHRKGY